MISVASDISKLQGMDFSREIEPAEKSSTSLSEKTGYQNSIYRNTANIFQGIHKEKPRDKVLVKYGNGPLPLVTDFKDERCQRLSYELAFSALKSFERQDDSTVLGMDHILKSKAKCILDQGVLENILIDSGVYPRYDQWISVCSGNAPGHAKEELPGPAVAFSVLRGEGPFTSRCRIKHDALSIECILPETIRKQQERASALPLFAWVNTLKVSLEEVHSTLQREGFTRVESLSKFDGCTYCLDVHCEDLLIFPSAVKEQLLTLELFTHYKLLLQDKSRSLAVHSVKSLLNMDDDILIAHAGSGLTVVHITFQY
uniref:Uncharacterized protein n=1 Tax=Sphaerodactylus townsendi TaxID=933632 RepID=A0ACB8E779_9SAUR